MFIKRIFYDKVMNPGSDIKKNSRSWLNMVKKYLKVVIKRVYYGRK